MHLSKNYQFFVYSHCSCFNKYTLFPSAFVNSCAYAVGNSFTGAQTASAPEASHAAPLCKNIYISHVQMNPRCPSIFWRCQLPVGSWVLTPRCKEKAYLSLSGFFRRSFAAASSAVAELGCLPESAPGFVHYPTGFGWRTASFCPGCFILLNTACSRVLCEWELELSHEEVCMKERGGTFSTWLRTKWEPEYLK